MYRDFYGFSEEPFRLTPDARFCFRHRSFAKARAYFQYALDHGEGFVLVTGRPGTGKTMLIDDLLAELTESRLLTVRIESAQVQADDLIRRIAYGFGLDPTGLDKATILHRLERRLENRSQRGERALLIVDEAQILSAESLEELRLLTNLRPYGHSLVQIFLVGQEALRDLIRLPELEQLHQRVLCACHLEPLSLPETREYIAHRLECAAWAGDPGIEAAVVTSFFRASEGIPRLINKLMDRLLLHGWLEERHRLDEGDARAVLEELRFELLFAAGDDGKLSSTSSDGSMLDITDIDRPSRIQFDGMTAGRLEVDGSRGQAEEVTRVLPELYPLDQGAPRPTEASANRSGFEDLFGDLEIEDRFDGQGVLGDSNWLDPPLSTPAATFTSGATRRDSAPKSEEVPRPVDAMASVESELSGTVTTGQTGTPSHGRVSRGESHRQRARRSDGRPWFKRVLAFLILAGLMLGVLIFRSFPGSSDSSVASRLGLGQWLGVRSDGSKDESPDPLGAFEHGHRPLSGGPDAADATTSQAGSVSSSDSPEHGVASEALQQAEGAPDPSPDASLSVHAAPDSGVRSAGADISDIEPSGSAQPTAESDAAGVSDPAVTSSAQASQGDLDLDNKNIRVTSSSDDGVPPIEASPGSSSEAASETDQFAPTPPFPVALALDLAELGLEHRDDDGRFAVNLREFVLFDFDSSDLSPESQIFLRQLGAILAGYPDLKLQVLGHTDDVGDPAYNQKLSLRRAESVVRYLSSVGVDPGRLEPIGLGSHQPLVSPDSASFSPALRHQNRRIELAVVPDT
jgi:type II secretory pathway predicted ATPase ExeA/outer membrane protein OmpA-like peptidoglycan-associated protein